MYSNIKDNQTSNLIGMIGGVWLRYLCNKIMPN